MFKKIPELTADPAAEKGGIKVEVDFALSDETRLSGWLLVRRAGGNNLLFASTATALRKPYKYQLDNDTLPADKLDELNRNLYADACVADFGGFVDEDGQPVAYSREAARALLAEYSEIYEIVREQANKAANYRQAAHNGAVDQGKGGSPGSSA
jgi:hypothetical protein